MFAHLSIGISYLVATASHRITHFQQSCQTLGFPRGLMTEIDWRWYRLILGVRLGDVHDGQTHIVLIEVYYVHTVYLHPTFWHRVSVRLTIPAKRTDIQTWILAWRSSGSISRSSSMVKVPGQRSRSRSQGQKCSLAGSIDVRALSMDMPRKRLRNTTGRIRRGVFSKRVWFFLYFSRTTGKRFWSAFPQSRRRETRKSKTEKQIEIERYPSRLFYKHSQVLVRKILAMHVLYGHPWCQDCLNHSV